MNGIITLSNVDYVMQQEYRAPVQVTPTPRVAVARKPNLLLLSWIAPVLLV
ncbi:MAG: hypothetical protein JWQ24_5521, partial [Tardiphaga sp.]|nr:hypothetical protein [Tardiphaga sp.]